MTEWMNEQECRNIKEQTELKKDFLSEQVCRYKSSEKCRLAEVAVGVDVLLFPTPPRHTF